MSESIDINDYIRNLVIPVLCADPSRFVEVMCNAVALNGSFFNTRRTIQQYLAKAYC